jgi:hypothetical protein
VEGVPPSELSIALITGERLVERPAASKPRDEGRLSFALCVGRGLPALLSSSVNALMFVFGWRTF